MPAAEVVSPPRPAPAPGSFTPFLLGAGLVVLAFVKVLYDLFRYGLATEIHSHVILIPIISAYLVQQDWAKLPRPGPRFTPLSGLFLALGVAALGGYFWLRATGRPLSPANYLALTTLPFWLLFTGISIWTLGPALARAVSFSLFFLIFLIPFPDQMTDALEKASQHASADVFSWMLQLTGATHYRDGLRFALPNITVQVAQECSGIRSSVVLFITSLIAGQMFLKSAWKKAFFALFVIPLGLARNGFRIYTISMLSAHVDPNIIHGPLHTRGGPIFFALSLIPFFILLMYLRKTDRKKLAPQPPNSAAPNPASL